MSFTKRPNDFLQERVVFAYEHAQLTQDTTVKLWKVPARFKVDRVLYVNPTGLAADAANFFAITVDNAAVNIATWSTETGQEGTIAANTFVLPTLAAAADRVLEAGEEISVTFDETGTATLPAGRLVIEGRYL